MTPVHMIKLVVGIDSLQAFHALQHYHAVEYEGVMAAPCWTRTRPKQAEEILRTGGSIYRVINNRIQCRHRILGFETVDTAEKGTMCVIMQELAMMRTMPLPKRAFQGWRYLKDAYAPEDMALYDGGSLEGDDAELQAELHKAGLL